MISAPRMYTILAESVKLVDENDPAFRTIMAFNGGAIGYNDSFIYLETRLGKEYQVNVSQVKKNLFLQGKYLHFKFKGFDFRLVVPLNFSLDENPNRLLTLASERFDNFAITFGYRLPDNQGFSLLVSSIDLLQSQSRIKYERIKANPLNLVEDDAVSALAHNIINFNDEILEYRIVSMINKFIDLKANANIKDLVELMSFYVIFFINELQKHSGRNYMVRSAFNKVVDMLTKHSSSFIKDPKVNRDFIALTVQSANEKMGDFNIIKKLNDFQSDIGLKFEF